MTTIPVDLNVANIRMYLGTVVAVVREELGRSADFENSKDIVVPTLVVMALQGRTVDDMRIYVRDLPEWHARHDQKPPSGPEIHGRLRSNGPRLFDDAGPWKWKMATGFDALRLLIAGGEQQLLAYLAWVSSIKGNGIRVFCNWKVTGLDFRQVPDYLGWDWRSKAGLPIVCVPGCPTHPDNLSETILYLLYQVAGQAPMIPLDEALRPTWLFGATVHEGCDRGGYYEQGDFADEYGSPKCLVKLGCWGPVVKCNVPKRGWINGVGGCPNVGGICIACTMPGFPDKFMPFMDEPPGSKVSATASTLYGTVIRTLRGFTAKTADEEPKWRKRGDDLLTGYQKPW